MRTPTAAVARFQPASDQSLLVQFDQRITLDAHRRVRKLLRSLEPEPVSGIRNLQPAYSSILVSFDPLKLNHTALGAILLGYSGRLDTIDLPEPRELQIPTCYGGGFCAALNEVGALH